MNSSLPDSSASQRTDILYAILAAFQNSQDTNAVIKSAISDICTFFQAKHIYITQQAEKILYEYIDPENQQPIQPENTLRYPLISKNFDGYLHIESASPLNINAQDYAWLKAISSLLLSILDKCECKSRELSRQLTLEPLQEMAQEIKYPLNNVISYAELLAITSDANDRQAYLQIIDVYNQQLIRTIDNICNFNKIQIGDISLDTSERDMNQILDDIEKYTIHRLDDTDITLHICKNLKKIIVNIDERHLSQIILNAVDYFISYSTDNKIQISYNLSDSYFDIDIQISSPHFNISNIDHLFKDEPNDLDDLSRIRLMICKRLTELMQGIFFYKEDPDSFHFIIQLSKNVVVSQQECKPTSLTSDKSAILVAEDNEFNFKLIDIILRGENIIHAWNGEEAVKLFKETDPKIVLMDLKMPVMDGYQATNLIRKMSTTVPIIAITAFTDDQQKIMNSGFSSYISKPIDTKILFHEIDRLLLK